MRLIDADKLIQEFETDSSKMLAKYHEEDYDPYYGGVLSAMQEVIKNIEKQPLSYDVDKVVEQLEEMKESACPKNRVPSTHELGEESAYEIAIQIVKAGGKDG